MTFCPSHTVPEDDVLQTIEGEQILVILESLIDQPTLEQVTELLMLLEAKVLQGCPVCEKAASAAEAQMWDEMSKIDIDALNLTPRANLLDDHEQPCTCSWCRVARENAEMAQDAEQV